MSATKLKPSAPLEPITKFEERLRKRMSDINIFKLPVVIHKEMIS